MSPSIYLYGAAIRRNDVTHPALLPGQPGWGVRVAAEMGDTYLGVEHALLAMIRDRDILNTALTSLGRSAS
jgi:hypothetical protein